ncbi:MAG: hypothetical protein WCR42_09240 [bacterium]
MTQKIYSAQLEVWEWKDILYKELNIVPRKNWAKHLNDLAKETIIKLERLQYEKCLKDERKSN